MIIEREFSENDFLNDKSFLLKLDNERNRRVFVKITVLDSNEMPIRDIEGQITTGGSINIDGNSAMRRTASISFVAEEKNNNLDDIDNLLSMNKRIKLSIGLENNIDKAYGDIVWFKQGIFIITNPSLSHSATAVNIGLNLKDKMCLLNGQSAGTLPTSVTFDSYDQIVNGERVSIKQKFYDIIQTSVINYGGESAENVLIEDVPLQNKQIVHWAGSSVLYYQPSNHKYQLEKPTEKLETWKQFEYNDEIGYVYTDFVYPKELKTTINSNISSGVLDSIISYLGNHEYYYDIDGRFRFREKRNYLNNSYDPKIDTRLDNSGREGVVIQPNGLSILDNTNYQVDFTRNDKYAYEFSENNSVVTSYSNSPNFQNIKNDFHIWGKNGDAVLHYHLVIKRKPKVEDFGTYQVYYELKDGKFTGRVRLATEAEIASGQSVRYTPKDWRAELYMQGLEAQKRQIRPDIYQQELLDLFDMIYDMKNQCFKEDIINKPNGLNYFFDYLEPSGKMQDYSVDNIGTRIHVEQKNNITKLYNMSIPNVCLVDVTDENLTEETKKCLDNGNMYSQVDHAVYENIQEGAIGYSAQDAVRNLLNQYTNFNETISIQCMPIYYLEPNTRIKVDDMASNIHGDYIIKSISLPIDGRSTMSITATRVQALAQEGIETIIPHYLIDSQGTSYSTTFFKADGTSQSGTSLLYRDMNDLTFPNKANSYKIGFHSGYLNWNKYACLRDPIIVGDNRKLYVKYFEYYDGGSYPNASIALAKSTTPGTWYYIPASAYKIFTVGNSQHNQAYYRNLTKDSSWTYTKARDDLDNPAWKIQEIDLESIEQFYLYFGCNNGYFYISDVWMTK